MIGQTFQPGTDTAYKKTLNQPMDGATPTQEALKVMSLRLPTVLSGRPITPDALLKPRVGGAVPGLPTGGGIAAPAAVQGTGANPYAGLMQIINAALGAGQGPTPSWTAMGNPETGRGTGPEVTAPPTTPTNPLVNMRGANLAKMDPESRFASQPPF